MRLLLRVVPCLVIALGFVVSDSLASVIAITNGDFSSGNTGWTNEGGGNFAEPVNTLASDTAGGESRSIMNVGGGGLTPTTTIGSFQTTGETITSGQKYTLTVDALARHQNGFTTNAGRAFIALRDAGNSNAVLASTTIDLNPTSSNFAAVGGDNSLITDARGTTLVYTADGSELGALQVFIGLIADDNNERVVYDNITLDGVAVPEPSSLLLLGIAGLGLLGVRRRRK